MKKSKSMVKLSINSPEIRINEKTFRDRVSGFMTLEIIIILLTVVLAVYFLFRPTSKKEKERFEDKDNWRGGF